MMFALHFPLLVWVMTSCAFVGRHHHHQDSATFSSSPLPPPRSGKACQDSQAILIDVENLRGKSGFRLSHADVLSSLYTWSQQSDLVGRLTCVVDHGSEATGLWLPDVAYAVVFSGRSQKADDVLALDLVPHFAQLPQVTVVTADHDLIQRCRRVSTVQQNLHILAPADLLDDLERILAESSTEEEVQAVMAIEDDALSALSSSSVMSCTSEESSSFDNNHNENDDDSISREASKQLEYEIKLGAELLEAEALVRSRSGVNNKRRNKLKQKVRSIQEKLAQLRAQGTTGTSMLDRVTDILEYGIQSSSLRTMTTAQQNALLSRWEKVMRSSNRKEKTGDRVILAERLRRELIDKYGLPSDDAVSTSANGSLDGSSGAGSTTGILPPGLAFVLKRQATMLPEITPKGDDGTLRVVVISDTHGFEHQLLRNGEESLPQGDVLLHLGDFATDHGPIKECLERFDSWLSVQPHPIKIVVRGNHDPRKMDFPISHATFVTQTMGLTIGGYSFFFAPYVAGLKSKSLPKTCDVLVSHVPPKEILDRCFNGQHVGHNGLRLGAERMKGGPPALWLCGHIHESRGSLRHVFAGDKETLVINAANADEGKATCIAHGPVVVDLKCNKETNSNKRAEIVSMDGQLKHMNQQKDMIPFFSTSNNYSNQNKNATDTTTNDDINELLMAVDLGLRTGVSLYNNRGNLLRFEQFQFDSRDALHIAARQMLTNWEADASNATHSWAVTKIAIEGGDPPLREAWRQAANGQRALLHVRPEEWRADLLVPREKNDGESSKAASRLIARQIVADYGVSAGKESDVGEEQPRLHSGKMSTDMAESILLGLHVSRRLGWISRNPPVRRYTNGGVILPD